MVGQNTEMEGAWFWKAACGLQCQFALSRLQENFEGLNQISPSRLNVTLRPGMQCSVCVRMQCSVCVCVRVQCSAVYVCVYVRSAVQFHQFDSHMILT